MRILILILSCFVTLVLRGQEPKINVNQLKGLSGGGSLFTKTDNTGNVTWSRSLDGNVLSGIGNGTLSSDAVNLGQLQGSVNGTLNYIPKFTAMNSIGNSNLTDDGATLTYYHGTSNDNSFTLYPSDYTTQATGIFFRTATNAVLRMVDGANFKIKHQSGDRLTINSSGNIGIGTSSPYEKLVVNGNINVGNVYLKGDGAVNTYFSRIVDLGSRQMRLDGYNGTDFLSKLLVRFDNGVDFQSTSNTTFGGNVGINTTAPTSKLDVNGATRLRGMVEFPTNTDFTYNAYYSGGWKYRVAGYAADIYQGGTGDISFLVAPSGSADAVVPFVSALRVLNTGGISVENFKVQNVANGSALTDAVNLSQAQNAAILTTGTLSDARLSSNVSLISTNNQLRFSDTRSVNDLPQDKFNGLYLDFKANATNGLLDGGTYNGVITLRQYGGTGTDWSGGLAHQIGVTDNGNLWHRNNTGSAPNVWTSWQKFALFNTDGTLNVATATSANHAVRLDQAQNASNLTTGTIPDARISINIARVADIKTATFTSFTLPTQSTDYTLSLNWNSYSINTYTVDGATFTGSNILISGSAPITGGLYNIIFTNVASRNLVFSSKFKNFDGVALSTISGTSAMRFKFVYNGTDYLRID